DKLVIVRTNHRHLWAYHGLVLTIRSTQSSGGPQSCFGNKCGPTTKAEGGTSQFPAAITRPANQQAGRDGCSRNSLPSIARNETPAPVLKRHFAKLRFPEGNPSPSISLRYSTWPCRE